jgi:hypothetical protein
MRTFLLFVVDECERVDIGRSNWRRNPLPGVDSSTSMTKTITDKRTKSCHNLCQAHSSLSLLSLTRAATSTSFVGVMYVNSKLNKIGAIANR